MEFENTSYRVLDGFSLSLDHNDIYGTERVGVILTNRSHDEVNFLLGNWVTHEIDARIGKHENPVRVLDLGGGIKSEAAKGFKGIYKDNIDITNIDLAFMDEPVSEVNKVLGKVEEMPFSSDSYDVIYSSFTFMHLSLRQRQAALKEISRVLAVGGVAIIDHEATYDGKDKSDLGLEDLALLDEIGMDAYITPIRVGPDSRLNKYKLLFIEKSVSLALTGE